MKYVLQYIWNPNSPIFVKNASAITMNTTTRLGKANIFNTKKDAEDYIALHTLFTRVRWNIIEVTNKELFKAKLAKT